MQDKYFIINDKPHKVIGIKNDRVIFQAMKYSCYNNPSYKIKFNHYDGYYINVGHKIIKLKEIFEKWDLYQDIKDYNMIKGDKNENI